MRQNETIWEYICVYVDDLLCAMKNPREFLDTLISKFNYKLKGDGPVDYHLGMDFGRDPDGTLFFGPMRYINKMMEAFTNLYGELPRETTSPLVKNDHPKIDTSKELGEEGISIYMSLIGSLQWLISLGRFDTATAGNSAFRSDESWNSHPGSD